MADPKGPETGQGAKGGHSARPRPQTLDLSAKEVSKSAAASSAASASSSPAGPNPATPTTAASSSATTSPPPAGGPAKSAAEAGSPGSKPESGKPESGKPDPGKPDPGKPEAARTEAPKTEAPKSEATKSEAARTEIPVTEAATAQTPEPEAAKPEPAAAGSGAARQEPPRPTRGVSSMPPAGSQAARPAAASSQPREGVGLLGVLAAAIGGAALAVLAIALFGKQLIRPPEPDMSRVTAAESKLDTVGRDVAALRDSLAKTAQATDTSAIDARLEEMSKSVTASIAQSNGRVEGVEKELRALAEQAAKPAPVDPALGVLAGRIEGVELRLQEAPTADALGVLGGRIAGLESRQAELPTQETIAGVASRVAAIGKTVEGVGQEIDDATAPLAAQIEQVSEALKARPKGDPAARLVVAIGALDQALAAGRSFAPELASVKAAAGENAELASLDPFAASGVPTRATLGKLLQAELAKLAEVTAAPRGSVLERFVANAGGVVKITPQDAGSGGGDPAAVRTRVAAAASAGDLEGALAARGKLDEAARAATEDWARLASARIAAETALGSARTAALARLSAND